MAKTKEKVTRFDADLVDAAAAEGARQSRSARQQLAHWVRVGRAVSSSGTASRARVEDALAGRRRMADLTAEEGVVVNAELAARIEERLAQVDFGADLAAEGVTTVALDPAGRLVEHHPDGTSTVLTRR